MTWFDIVVCLLLLITSRKALHVVKQLLIISVTFVCCSTHCMHASSQPRIARKQALNDRPVKDSAETLHRIFLVPHTHDDVGWLYTVGAYFNNSVTHILSSVTADLGANPTHRFIWSEVKWVEMWWPLQVMLTTPSKLKSLKSLCHDDHRLVFHKSLCIRRVLMNQSGCGH